MTPPQKKKQTSKHKCNFFHVTNKLKKKKRSLKEKVDPDVGHNKEFYLRQGRENVFTLKQLNKFESSATKESVFSTWVSWLQSPFRSLTPTISHDRM